MIRRIQLTFFRSTALFFVLAVSIAALPMAARAADPMFAGTDGALTINGTTVNISPSTKLYSSVSITNGGILNIVGNGSWMIIGSAGSFTIDATSKIQYIGVGTTTANGTGSSTTSPDGVSLSYSSNYASDGGGAGGGVLCGTEDFLAEPGNPLSAADGKCGGSPLYGNGGGGAAFDYNDGHVATLSAGGAGANGSLGGLNSCLGGAGGTINSKDGADGEDCFTSAPYYTNGAGGGGGFRGDNGGAIYIKVAGTVTIAGTIDVSGSAGGTGGDGGDATDEPAALGGGGGGGGDGGNGGKIQLVYISGSVTGSLLSDIAGGGAGGAGGVGFSGNAVNGDPGEPAANDGNSGTVEQTVLAIPTVSASSPTGTTGTASTLNSSLSATGGTTVTVRGFIYGLTTAYGATTTESSGTLGAFTASLTSLTCGSTYNWKAYATNAVGTRYTSNSTFSTSACPTPDPTPSSSGSSGSRSRVSVVPTVQPTPIPGCPAGFVCVLAPSVNQSPVYQPTTYTFTRPFRYADEGEDVRNLQRYLNARGYIIAVSGSGSPGNESDFYGYLTQAALMRFQRDHGIPATGNFGPITRAYIAAHP
ncbi:MAG: hypothetical protein RLY66_258 [Candidatus Parcubacteria bacterium]|jgi:hypothetical protein